MKGRVLQSKAMMLVSRLPFSLSFFFFVEIWLQRSCNYDNYFCFSSMHKLSFDDELCIVCLMCTYVAFVFSTLCTCGRMNRSS